MILQMTMITSGDRGNSCTRMNNVLYYSSLHVKKFTNVRDFLLNEPDIQLACSLNFLKTYPVMSQTFGHCRNFWKQEYIDISNTAIIIIWNHSKEEYDLSCGDKTKIKHIGKMIKLRKHCK